MFFPNWAKKNVGFLSKFRSILWIADGETCMQRIRELQTAESSNGQHTIDGNFGILCVRPTFNLCEISVFEIAYQFKGRVIKFSTSFEIIVYYLQLTSFIDILSSNNKWCVSCRGWEREWVCFRLPSSYYQLANFTQLGHRTLRHLSFNCCISFVAVVVFYCAVVAVRSYPT